MTEGSLSEEKVANTSSLKSEAQPQGAGQAGRKAEVTPA